MILKRLNILIIFFLILNNLFIIKSYCQDIYKVDNFHSFIIFEIKNYAQLGNIVVGRFNKIEGEVIINENDITKSKVNIKIPVDSIDTGWKERDQHLLGPDFFNSKEYPYIYFNSLSINSLAPNEFLITGTLKLLNISKIIKFPVAQITKGKNLFNQDIIVYNFSYSLNRSEFGMDKYLNIVGDKVDLRFYIQLIKDTKDK
jgi:polyisoprenoid-binding protein YceI